MSEYTSDNNAFASASARAPSSTGPDISGLIERTGGDPALALEVAKIFLEEAPVLLHAIRSAIAAGDARRLEWAAHSFKGCVSNFGADATTKAAQELEMLARHTRLEEAPAALGHLEAEFAALVPVLHELIRGR